MPFNERIVKAATAAMILEDATLREYAAAGPILPQMVREAVVRRLGLDTRDEAMLIQLFAGCMDDAAVANNSAAAAAAAAVRIVPYSNTVALPMIFHWRIPS